MVTENPLLIFSGRANPALTESICGYLQIEMGRIRLGSFSDGELFCQIEENARGADVFIVQPTGPPANQNLMELLIMLDAFRRASPARVCVVMPYMGYARQDRKDAPRVPITAKLIANLITTAGAGRVLTIDLHAAQIQGFFDIPVDHLYAAPVLIEAIRRRGLERPMLVSPDAGGVERARAFAKRLKLDLAIMDKRRPEANRAEIMNVIGNVDGCDCVIVDDIIDTAGTLVHSAQALIERGARSVSATGVHAVFSGPAIDRIAASPIERVMVTDTLALSDAARSCPKVEQLSLAVLLGEAIRRIHEGASVSSLFV
ncbi:MAG: ribose-phosphate pyrophosphokinase [Thermoanaerobaculales bacterium]|jgi:ribose-phosphate pyrophosphokinase|nr:ribose-phosphate pyrophosphokinase [Thermoanaerobaculales bacterium]